MDNQKLKIVTARQLIILILLFFTTIIYYLSLYQGTGGIGLKIFGGGDDGQFYWEQAQNVVNDEPWIKTSIYPFLLGTLIKITGVNDVYIVRLFNLLGFNILVIYSIKILRVINIEGFENRDESQEYSYLIIKMLVCYSMYISLISTVILSIYRDIWIYSFYIVSVYYSLNVIYNKRNKLYSMICLLVSIYLIYQFRKYAAMSFIVSIIVYFIANKFKLLKNKKFFSFFLLIFCIIYYKFFKEFEISGFSLAKALDYRFDSIELYSGGSNMNIRLNQSNLFFFIVNYIHSYLGNFVGPLPWYIKGSSMSIIFILETIPMMYILFNIFKQRKLLNNIEKYILYHSFIWIGIIAITNDNVGTATRLRVISWLLLFLVFLSIRSKELKNRRFYNEFSNR